MNQPATKAKQPATKDMLPVRLLKNYRPIGAFVIDGEEPTGDQTNRVTKGTVLLMNADEARNVVKNNVAERGDEF